MLIKVKDVTVSSVWSEEFKGREGDMVQYYRALVTVPGEAPLQLGVREDDFAALSARIGATGTATVELDARPGNRVRVYLREVA